MQSHSTLPCGVRTSSARWPIAKDGLDADADRSGSSSRETTVVPGELGHGRPLLAVPADVLAFVLADRAAARRPVGVWVLHTAGRADPGRHQGLLSSSDTGLVPIRPRSTDGSS